MARHRRKALISAKVEMRAFCLLRLCPNPRRTLVRVLETLENSSGYAILQIAKWESTPIFFRFSLRGERIVTKNPIYICLGSLQGAHILPGFLVICVHGFFLRQELGVFCLQALDGGQFFQSLFIEELLCRLMKYYLRLMLGKEFLGVASLAIGNIGVAGLGVVDDVLLQHFNFRHALLGGLHLSGKGVVLRCDSGSPFFQNASVQQIVFLQIDQRLGKLFQIEVSANPFVLSISTRGGWTGDSRFPVPLLLLAVVWRSLCRYAWHDP